MRNQRGGVIAFLVATLILVLAVIKLSQVSPGQSIHNPKAEVSDHLPTYQNQRIHVTDASRNFGVQKIFPDGCRCQSLFTVDGCNMKQVNHTRADGIQASTISGLSSARLEGTQLFKFMEILGKNLPPLLKADLKTKNNDVLDVSLDDNLSRATQSLSFVPCKMHIYTPNDVKICTDAFKRKWDLPLIITFVGDSRNRNTMEEIIKMLNEELNLQIVDEDLNHSISYFIETKRKSNILVKGDNIEITLIWANILDRKLEKPARGDYGIGYGARDIFEVWSEGKPWIDNHTNQIYPLPHLLVVNTGVWHTSGKQNDVAVSDFIHSMHIMTPLLKKLSMRIRILWPLHGPVKEYLAQTPAYFKTPALDMMNNIAWLRLQNSNVWLWDTRTILVLRQKQECFEFFKAGLVNNLPNGWRCQDILHTGKDVERGAINMIWNLLCNSLLEMKDEYCCA